MGKTAPSLHNLNNSALLHNHSALGCWVHCNSGEAALGRAVPLISGPIPLFPAQTGELTCSLLSGTVHQPLDLLTVPWVWAGRSLCSHWGAELFPFPLKQNVKEQNQKEEKRASYSTSQLVLDKLQIQRQILISLLTITDPTNIINLSNLGFWIILDQFCLATHLIFFRKLPLGIFLNTSLLLFLFYRKEIE